MAVEDDYADLVASTPQSKSQRWAPTPDVADIIDRVVQDRIAYERTGGAEGRAISAQSLSDWLRKRKGITVGEKGINRYVAARYGRGSLSQP
jgi:hypothetical protein